MASEMEPVTIPAPSELPLSNQVCINCRIRKRKCSKTKPSCDLCRRLLLKCVYEDPRAAEFKVGGVHNRTQLLVQDDNNNLDWLSSANFMAKIMKHNHEIGSPASMEVHNSFMKQVLRIIVDNGATIPAFFSEYFRTVAIWLPAIVSEKMLYKRLQGEPSIEVALLILSIFLSVQAPDRNTANEDFPQTQIYFASKSLLSAIIGTGALSLDIVQANVMILLYEAGQGLLDQARMSATICTQIGMRYLSRRRCQQRESLLDIDHDDEKLWSCIMMLDRFLSLGLPVNEIQSVAGGGMEWGGVISVSGSKNSMKLPPSPQSHSDLGVEDFDRYVCLRKSVGLVSQVFDYLKSIQYERAMDLQRFTSLDDQLQSLLGKLLRNSFQSWEESCESIGLLFGALFSIHKARYDMWGGEARDQNNATQKQLASMAIQYIINMLLDISRDFNERVAFIEINAIPLPSTFAIYQAAMLHISFAGNRFDTKQWNEDISSLRTTLGTFGKRWSIVGQYIKDIDNALQEEKRARTMNHGMIS